MSAEGFLYLLQHAGKTSITIHDHIVTEDMEDQFSN